MVTRRNLLGVAAGAGVVAFLPAPPVQAAAGSKVKQWRRRSSQNGWRIDLDAIDTHRIEGSSAYLGVRRGEVAAVLLHVARRWHYEIAPLDTGEGGGVSGYTTDRRVRAAFESNYLSGTALALHPFAYPLRGSEKLWPYHEEIVRDILLDCAGVVVWGGDLNPVKASHFHVVAKPADNALARVAAQLDTTVQTGFRSQTAGAVADPATPARRTKAKRLRRPADPSFAG